MHLKSLMGPSTVTNLNASPFCIMVDPKTVTAPNSRPSTKVGLEHSWAKWQSPTFHQDSTWRFEPLLWNWLAAAPSSAQSWWVKPGGPKKMPVGWGHNYAYFHMYVHTYVYPMYIYCVSTFPSIILSSMSILWHQEGCKLSHHISSNHVKGPQSGHRPSWPITWGVHHGCGCHVYGQIHWSCE